MNIFFIYINTQINVAREKKIRLVLSLDKLTLLSASLHLDSVETLQRCNSLRPEKDAIA